jgi:hypothetical protein
LPFGVVDLELVSNATVLPTKPRSLSEFTFLGRTAQARALIEFKLRVMVAGDGLSNGTDADEDWRPTMTLPWGLPMLLDPRLCIVQKHKSMNYPKQLRREHTADYNWHLNSRLTDIAREKASRAAAAEHRSAAIAKAKERAVKGAEVDAASRDVEGNLRMKPAKIEEREPEVGEPRATALPRVQQRPHPRSHKKVTRGP